MIAHNWLASRWRTIPGLPCPARPSMPCQAHHHLLRSHQPGCTKTANAAAGGTTTMLHNSCLAPPCTSTSTVWCTSPPPSLPPPPKLFHLQTGKGAWQPPSTTPWKGGGDFLQTCEFGAVPSCVQWRRDPAPSARSWQCISNANSCQLLPTLGNLRWSARKGEKQKP